MTEAQTVADLCKQATWKGHTVSTADGREFLITPPQFEQTEVTSPEYKTKFYLPDHIRQHVQVHSADSLIEYVERYKDDPSIIFADVTDNVITAVLDYHSESAPAHGAHRATLRLSHSVEWELWHRINGKYLEQLDFARFIEENAADIRAPFGADLLECVRDLQAHRKVDFTKAVRTSSENESFEWKDETETRSKSGGIEIPTKFKLGIPVYFDEADTELFAFLRWALDPPSLKLGIQLHRPEHVRQAVFKAIVMRIAEQTECLAVFGKI